MNKRDDKIINVSRVKIDERGNQNYSNFNKVSDDQLENLKKSNDLSGVEIVTIVDITNNNRSF